MCGSRNFNFLPRKWKRDGKVKLEMLLNEILINKIFQKYLYTPLVIKYFKLMGWWRGATFSTKFKHPMMLKLLGKKKITEKIQVY